MNIRLFIQYAYRLSLNTRPLSIGMSMTKRSRENQFAPFRAGVNELIFRIKNHFRQ